MTNDEHDRTDVHPEAPWWWGIGPVGAVLVIIAGVAGALWAFLGSGDVDVPVVGYQVGKIIAIGLVLLGAAVMEHFRSRHARARKAAEDGPAT
ncbi:hypothetical protein ACFV6Z_07240 [Streptomyces sp. NPDC059818]|uniref:hypothetical protein n=1 Tax=Streptomyces sp. NPDC059818 TaxID=3346962 RepID=UPI00365D2CC7